MTWDITHKLALYHETSCIIVTCYVWCDVYL